MIAVVAAVALVVAGFVALYKTGWTFGSALEAVGDNLKSFFILLQEGFLSVLDTVTFGDANKTVKARQAELAIEKEALAKREAARDAERAIKTKERSSEGKEEKRAEVKAELRKTLTPGSKEPARPEAKTEASSETAKTESTPTVAGEAPKKSSVAGAESATAKSKDPIEILRAEIKTLNTQLESMTRFMRDAADNTGKTASILASKGNLFK